MSTPVRLLAFAAALAAVFVLALVGARTLLPADLAQAGQDRTGHPSSNPPRRTVRWTTPRRRPRRRSTAKTPTTATAKPRPLTRSAASRSPRTATSSAR